MSIPGQQEVALPDGRRLVSAARAIEDGARGVLLLEPGRFRVDATPGEDMFRITLRNLSGSALSSRSQDRPESRLAAHGIDALDLPLIGTAALEVRWDEHWVYDLTVGTLRDPGRGATTFTVQALVRDEAVSPAASGTPPAARPGGTPAGR